MYLCLFNSPFLFSTFQIFSRADTIDSALNSDVNSLHAVLQRLVQRIEDLDELRRSFENAANRISKRKYTNITDP